jgi:hypothetical protein
VKEETSRVGVTEQNKLLVTCLVVEYPRALAAAVACRNGGMVCAASRGVALEFFFLTRVRGSSDQTAQRVAAAWWQAARDSGEERV